jgi:hypothetical protein
MNRHERRKASKLTRQMKLDRVVAIHEAGHAVARVLTADDMGLKPEEAVAWIEVGLDASAREGCDGQNVLVSQATTYGPMFSREIEQHTTKTPGTALTTDVLLDTVAKARKAGADIEAWLSARSLFTVFASVAEVKWLNVPFLKVWHSHGSESDVVDFARTALLAGLDNDATEALAK